MNLSLDRAKLDLYISKRIMIDNSKIVLSTQFKTQYFFLIETGRIYESYINDAINKIANNDKENGEYKEDSQFNGSLLRGIWKKHYFQPYFDVENLKSELKNTKSFTNKKIDQLFKEYDGKPFADIMPEIVNLLSLEFMQNRYSQHSVTGEWILYMEYKSKFYVLTFANHKEGKNRISTDKNIRQRLDNSCFKEFPELKNCLFLSDI